MRRFFGGGFRGGVGYGFVPHFVAFRYEQVVRDERLVEFRAGCGGKTAVFYYFPSGFHDELFVGFNDGINGRAFGHCEDGAAAAVYLAQYFREGVPREAVEVVADHLELALLRVSGGGDDHKAGIFVVAPDVAGFSVGVFHEMGVDERDHAVEEHFHYPRNVVGVDRRGENGEVGLHVRLEHFRHVVLYHALAGGFYPAVVAGQAGFDGFFPEEKGLHFCSGVPGALREEVDEDLGVAFFPFIAAVYDSDFFYSSRPRFSAHVAAPVGY